MLYSRVCIVFNIDLVTTPAFIRCRIIYACSSDEWCVQHPTLCSCWHGLSCRCRAQTVFETLNCAERALCSVHVGLGLISWKHFVECVWSPSDIQCFPLAFQRSTSFCSWRRSPGMSSWNISWLFFLVSDDVLSYVAILRLTIVCSFPAASDPLMMNLPWMVDL